MEEVREYQPMKDKIVVVTGANDGIGKETALGLATLGATVVMACRNLEKANSARDYIVNRSKNEKVHIVELDLSNFDVVEKCATTINNDFNKVDVLLNNAGGYWSTREISDYGIERTFLVNHIGPFYLTHLLMDQIKLAKPARVVTLSSVAHFGARGPWTSESINGERGFRPFSAYSKSKLANLLFAKGLAEKLDASCITSNAVHPGAVRSGFGMDGDLKGISNLGNKIIRPFEISAKMGARTSIYLASSNEVNQVTGKYFVRMHKSFTSRRAAKKIEIQELWDLTLKMLEPIVKLPEL